MQNFGGRWKSNMQANTRDTGYEVWRWMELAEFHTL
jgi:hypothetical protein